MALAGALRKVVYRALGTRVSPSALSGAAGSETKRNVAIVVASWGLGLNIEAKKAAQPPPFTVRASSAADGRSAWLAEPTW
jgi:hypothetical protein